MKKRLWKPPQPSDTSAAVDIPELKEKEKKKKGAPFWMGAGQSTEAIYGSLESIPGVEASQAAASAAVRAAASALEADTMGEAVSAVAGASSDAAGGFLARFADSLVSYWPESLIGKVAAAGMLLITAGALTSGAALFAKAAATGVPMAGLGGIVSSLHYMKPPSKSLLYAAAAARNMPSAAQSGVAKAEDAIAAGGFTGQVAPGAPVGQKGNLQGPPTLGGSPWGRQNSFDGSAAGEGSLSGAAPPSAGGKNGKLSGAFQQSVDGKGVGGALKVAANTGSPFARLGRFGSGSSQSLGLLRSMKTYIPGMTSGNSNPGEIPAQLAAEQFDHSNLIGASAPSAPSIGNGTPDLLTSPNAGGGSGGGSGGSNNSCAQDGMVWNGSGCTAPSAPPGQNSSPWQSAMSSANMLLPIAAGLMIMAAILTNIPFGWGKPAAYVLAILAAVLGGVVLLQGTGMIGGGQKTGGGTLVTAGILTVAGAWAAFGGSFSAGPELLPTVIGAIAGVMSSMMQSFTPPPPPQTPPTNGSGSSGSGSSSGTSNGTGG